MRDWNNMPKEIVTKVTEHVEFYEDFVRLQNTCTHWRSAAKDANFRACVKTSSCLDEHTLPLLMLPELAESTTIRRLYSLSKHKVCHIQLPTSSPLNFEYDKKRLLSAYGWLLVLSQRAKHHFLFNPFTNAVIKLPRINYYHIDPSDFKLCLSANPSTSCDFAAFVSFYLPGFPLSILIYWRKGDNRWTRVRTPNNSPWLFQMSLRFTDVTYYKGEFYGANEAGLIAKFQTSQGDTHFQVRYELPTHTGERGNNYYYLVESLGQLLVICQEVQCVGFYRTFPLIKRFRVFALDYENATLEEVMSLGNRSIFIGSNSSFSVEVSPSLARSHGFKPNCIYYINNWGGVLGRRGVRPGGRDHCVYNVAKRAFETEFHKGFLTDFDKLTPFTWVEPPMYYFN